MSKYIPKLNTKYVIEVFTLFVVYFVTAKFGLSFYAIHHFATMIWIPTGIALASLIIYDRNLWPAITFASFLVNYSSGAPVIVAASIALGNTLEAVVGMYLLQRYVVLYRCFERLIDTLYFIGIVILVATPISATIGVLSIFFGHIITSGDVWSTWITWWIGDVLGALVVTPFILTCFSPTRRWNADNLSWLEIISFTFLLITTNLVIFWYHFSEFTNIPFLYLILLPLIWGGLRFGSRGMTFSILITLSIATVATVLGHGPFVTNSTVSNILFLQIFIASIAITFLVFLSIVKERKLFMKKLEEHVNVLEDALKKISVADQAKNDFLAILAHELRNPLAPILSSLELMKMHMQESTIDEPETAGLIQTMETHMHTFSRLLNDLMDISRMSRKKLVLEKEKFNIQDIINRSIEAAESRIRSKNHTLTVTMSEKPIYMYGDPIRIEQIIVNLIVNAGKYTDAHGSIVITCKTKNGSVIISVKDNGAGISPDMLKRIFEPFLQIQTTNGSSGLGIGLSLTQELVDLHNGSIVAQSKGLGMGSEFIVVLPLSDDIMEMNNSTERGDRFIGHLSPVDSTNINDIVSTVLQKKYNILVVDDNVAAAQGISELLRRKGHTVESTHDALAVVDIIKKNHPHIVILDIGLPHMDGYQLAEHIRQEILGELTLIALTGYGQEEDKRHAKRVGFNFHLTKPVSIKDIEEIIATL